MCHEIHGLDPAQAHILKKDQSKIRSINRY